MKRLLNFEVDVRVPRPSAVPILLLSSASPSQPGESYWSSHFIVPPRDDPNLCQHRVDDSKQTSAQVKCYYLHHLRAVFLFHVEVLSLV